MKCAFLFYEIENKIVKSKEGKTEYLLKDLVYLLRVEEHAKAHYIYITNIAHFLSLRALYRCGS
ncbi:MAG: hypothetical protein ACKPKO_14630 [Candidatus Fonsibacter sp.]